MYEIKTEYVYKDFSSNKEMFDFGNLTKSKYYDNSNKLVVCKIKDERICQIQAKDVFVFGRQ